MSTAKIVGNRLRRYLGALLAVGFGTTWWSLVPPAKAAAVTIQEASKPKLLVAPVVTPVAEPEEPPIHVSMRLPDPKPKPPRRTIVVADPPIVAVIDPLLPVTAPIVVPVNDPIVIPAPQPEPEPEVIRDFPIRTRSS